MAYTLIMPDDFISTVSLTIQQYPTLALLLVFLVAFSESLIIVGLIVPGAILMVLFGALIAIDALAFWPTVLFAISGAVAGDSLSYWLGRRYQSKLHSLWPLSRHPDLIIRANDFFNRYGTKSIILGRFIGPLRPVIPAIAGMSKMPGNVFLAANIGSAIFWAPLYLLPGLLFGLSVEMASEFASKFIILIVALLFLIFLSLWLIQRLYFFIKPYNDKLTLYFLNWGKKHPLVGEVPAAIFDESHSEMRGLSLLAIIIFSGTLILTFLYNTITSYYDLSFYNFDSLNRLIYYSLQTFRSPPLDNFMLWLTYISSNQFIALIYFSFGSLFIWKKDFPALWHLLAVICLPLLLSPFMSNPLTHSLQEDLNLNTQTVPFIVVVSVIGFTTVLINSGLSFRKQKLYYYFSATLVLLLMMAQLYFALQVFSQILLALIVGTIWFSLLGIAYRRHSIDPSSNNSRKEIVLILCILLFYPGLKITQQEKIYSLPDHYFIMGKNSWLETGWKLLPTEREGVYKRKNNFFNLQWAGTKQNITSRLLQLGFIKHQNSIKTLSNWFLETATINQLPVLPHIHQGQYETLRFYRYNKEKSTLTVVRLWPSIYKLKQSSPLIPLWFGSISMMTEKSHLGIRYLVTQNTDIYDIQAANIDLIGFTKINGDRLLIENKADK